VFSASAINAALTLDATLLAKEGLIIVLGYNLPMLQELQKRKVGHHIAVYDPDYAGPVLEGVHKFDGTDFSFFDAWHPQIINGQMLVIAHNPTVAANPEPYEAFKAKLAEQKRLMESNIGTQIALGRNFMGSFLENIPVIMRKPGVTALKNLFPGVPAILISAGSSLEKNGDLLKEARGCLLIAVDSALPYLIAQGIRPHFVVAVDPMPENAFFFTDYEFLKDTAFVCLAQYTPEVVKAYLGPVFFSCSPGSAIYQWLGRFMGEDRGYLPCDGGSVSHMALTLAEHLGCSPMAFLGLDLSWKEKFYAGHASKLLGQRLEGPETVTPVPTVDMHGNPCWTTGTFEVFRICFENKLAANPQIEAYNCSEGVEIKGAPVLSLDEFLSARIPIEKPFSFPEDSQAQVNPEPLLGEIILVSNLFEEILHRAERASVLVSLIDSAYKKKQAHKMQARIDQLSALSAKIRSPYLNLIAYYCYGLELFMQHADIRDVDKITDANERLEKEIARGREYYQHLTDGIRDFLKPLRSLKKQLKD
jgi:hypothetical protein